MSSLLLTVLSVSSCVSFCRSVFCQCAIHRHRARLPFYGGKRRVKDLSAMLKSGHVSALFVSAVIKSKLWQDKKKKKALREKHLKGTECVLFNNRLNRVQRRGGKSLILSCFVLLSLPLSLPLVVVSVYVCLCVYVVGKLLLLLLGN